MSFKNLKTTKRNLTIIFTLLVFFIAILLEIVYFSAKYFNHINIQENSFNNLTNTIQNKDISLKEFVTRYDI
jgi:hypothetical protein